MSIETPVFTTKPIEKEHHPKKRKRPAKRTEGELKNEYDALDKKVIDQKITAIYQDSSGHLPNMKQFSIKKSHPALKFFLTILTVGALLSAAAWAGFIFLPQKRAAAPETLNFVIDGPARVPAGAPIAYTIKLSNDQDKTIKDITLSLRYPTDFVFTTSSPEARNTGHTEWQFSSLSPNEKKEVIIMGFATGAGQQQSWRAVMTYRPDNMPSELQKMAILNVTVEEPAFNLTLSGPNEAKIGEEIEYSFNLQNNTALTIPQIELKPILPANFSIVSSSPALGRGSVWSISPTSSAVSAIPFKLRGKFTSVSATATTTSIQGALSLINVDRSYLIATASSTTQIVESNLNFSLAINGSLGNLSVRPGEPLNMTIHIKNPVQEVMNDASVKLTLDGPSANNQSILNWKEINDPEDGDIRGQQLSADERRGQITWNKSHLPTLKKIQPGQEVNLDLRLPVRNNQIIDLNPFKLFDVKASVELTYNDSKGAARTLTANPVTVTVNSDLKFETRDMIDKNENDQETHAVSWILNNNFHPLRNITVTADVYGDVLWGGGATPAGTVAFNESEKKITWTIPDMPESVDVLALSFNLTLKSKNQTQRVLISKTRVEAEDTVTGQKINFQGPETGLE